MDAAFGNASGVRKWELRLWYTFTPMLVKAPTQLSDSWEIISCALERFANIRLFRYHQEYVGLKP